MKVIELLLRMGVVITILGGAIFLAGAICLIIGAIIVEVIDKRG